MYVRMIDGKKVMEAREAAFLSKGELAKGSGLDRSTISRIEKGCTIRVHPKTVRAIAAALGMKPTQLVPESE